MKQTSSQERNWRAVNPFSRSEWMMACFLLWTSIRTNQECSCECSDSSHTKSQESASSLWSSSPNRQEPITTPVRLHQSAEDRKYNTAHTAAVALSHDKQPSCSLLCHVWLQRLVYGTVKMHCAIECETLTVTWAGGGPSTPDCTDPTFSPLNNRAGILIPAGRALTGGWESTIPPFTLQTPRTFTLLSALVIRLCSGSAPAGPASAARATGTPAVHLQVQEVDLIG